MKKVIALALAVIITAAIAGNNSQQTTQKERIDLVVFIENN